MTFEQETFKKLGLTIALVSLLVIIIIFITYSLTQGNNPNNITTDIIKVDEEVYGNTSFDASKIKFSPILDKDVNKDSDELIYIKFTVGGSRENSTDEAIYDIALVDLNVDCNLLSPYIKWKLIKNNNEISSGSLDYKFDTIVNNRLVLTNIQEDLIPYDDDKTKYDNYEFYMWFSDSCQEEDITKCDNIIDQTNLLNKSISGKLEVELYGKGKNALVRNPQDKIDYNSCINNVGDSIKN